MDIAEEELDKSTTIITYVIIFGQSLLADNKGYYFARKLATLYSCL